MHDLSDPDTADEPKSSLKASEQRFRLLVESVRDYAIFMLDPGGIIVSWNEGARRIKGYEAAEIIGQPFTRFYPREALERGWPEHELKVAGRVGRFEDEGWRLRKDGSLFWAHVVITALRDEGGKLLGFSKITRDLTERRRREEALRQSEERFRLMVEGVRDYAIFMLDAQGFVVSWNVGAARIKGYRAEEIVGQHFSRFYPEEALRRGWPAHELAVAERVGHFEDEGWRVRKDGTWFWANVVITALHDQSGRLYGFAKVTRDLTERRKIEQLQEEGRRIGNFLAMLGHELRNPLAPIRNAATVLRGSAESPDSKVAWAGEVIERQTSHLARIVDDLLDLGRVDRGKVSLQRERLDLVALVEAAVEQMRPSFEAAEQELALATPEEPLFVLGDATRLTQVAVNLLSNANKYTPKGGHIEVVVEKAGRHAELRVCDDGVGIPGDLLPRIFEPFEQGERGLDRADGGLGIGLTLVKRLVELHEGSVSASSAGVDQGTELVVRLALIERGEAAAVSGPRSTPTPRTHRIVVVDDNPDAVESLALLLEMWGHEVFTAPDGPSALEAVSRHRPDVVILDIGLPGMSGYDVAERLHDTPCVLVAMTGYAQRHEVERAHCAGFAHHLAKPVDTEKLERLLNELPGGGPAG